MISNDDLTNGGLTNGDLTNKHGDLMVFNPFNGDHNMI